MENNYDTSEYYRTGRVITERATSSLLRNVYLWMCGALAITGLTAYYVANNAQIVTWLFSGKAPMIILIVVELALVVGLSAAIDRISALVATLMFLLYSTINGVTLCTIFMVYDPSAITTTFLVTAGTFGTMAVFGSVTRRDLTKVGNICLMAVIGLIIATVVNLFLRNSMFSLIVSGIGVLVFTGLTAYDAQKIKEMLYNAEENETNTKIAVLGALSLYLDFINLFLYILRFFNRK